MNDIERDETASEAAEMELLRQQLNAARERFRSIIENSADGVMVVDDGSGLIQFANRYAGQLFGRPPDVLLGSPFGHPMVVGETTEIDLVREGEPLVAELRVMETEWEGKPARIVSLRDITDRKAAEDSARELVREQMARAEAEEAAHRAEFLAEAARRLSTSLALEQTIQELADLVVEEFADYCILDLVEGEDVSRFAAAREPERMRMGEARQHVLRIRDDTPQARAFRERRPTLVRHVDDEWLRSAAHDEEHLALLRELKPRSVVFVPLDSGRDCLGLFSAVSTRSSFRERDLHLATELGRHAALAIENARLYRDAEAANQAKANFLSVMSHELRTPLSAIIGYTDLIDRGVVGEITEKQSAYMGRIRASSSHLLQIIEEILAFAGTEAGKESVHPEETTLAELMEGVTVVAEPLARESELAFDVLISDGGATLRTDSRKTRQILLNLISNAFKFTEEGSVQVRARLDGEQVVFEVQDTGVGIPADRHDEIFERFWQMEEALTRKVGGTGLGLSVALSFARLLDGTLEVESEPGVGSTFTLRIARYLRD
jgi:signal transduction histidine kinase